MSTHAMETRSAGTVSVVEAEEYTASITTELTRLYPDSVLPEHRCSRCRRLASQHTDGHIWECSDDDCRLDDGQYLASLKTQFLGLRRFWVMFDNREACHTMATTLAMETAKLKEEVKKIKSKKKKKRKDDKRDI